MRKFAARNRFLRHFVGGGQDAHIHRSFDFASQAAQFAVFENAQEFGLGADGHFANFIEQQSAAFGEFEASGAALQGAGESAFLVAEDFAFHRAFQEWRRS